MSSGPSLRATEAGIRRAPIVRVSGDERAVVDDELAIEEPLELRVAGETLATTLRTPGSDHELVAGWLLAEGIVDSTLDLLGIAHCGHVGETGYGNVIEVQLNHRRALPEEARRAGVISSACGVCGRAQIESLTARLRPLPHSARFDPAWLHELPTALRNAQPNFARTGGLHAAGVARSGQGLQVVREDIGRHNAVDKVVGRLLLDGALPAPEAALVVSGRAGFEIVHKALGAGISALVSLSAPSSLAVDTARAFGLLLVGFTRVGGFNVYSGAERLLDSGERLNGP